MASNKNYIVSQAHLKVQSQIKMFCMRFVQQVGEEHPHYTKLNHYFNCLLGLTLQVARQELNNCKLRLRHYKETNELNYLVEEEKKERDLNSYIKQYVATCERSEKLFLDQGKALPNKAVQTVQPVQRDEAAKLTEDDHPDDNDDDDNNRESECGERNEERLQEMVIGENDDKDGVFIRMKALKLQMADIVRRSGLKTLSIETCVLLSEAVQQRMLAMMETILINSQHRQESHRMLNQSEFSIITQDVKQQLLVFKRMDRLALDMKNEEDKRLLKRQSRTKMADADTLQLKQKAKQLKDEEELIHTHIAANQTAMAQIYSVNKKRKTMLSSSQSQPLLLTPKTVTGSAVSGDGLQQATRRLHRVLLKDLIKCLEDDKDYAKSNLLYRALLRLR